MTSGSVNAFNLEHGWPDRARVCRLWLAIAPQQFGLGSIMSSQTSPTGRKIERGDVVVLSDGSVGLVGTSCLVRLPGDEFHVDLPVRSHGEPTYTFGNGVLAEWGEVRTHRAVGTDGDLARKHLYEAGFRGVDGERWVMRSEEDAVGDVERRVLFPVPEEAWDHEHIEELTQGATDGAADGEDGMCGYEDDGFVVPDGDEEWSPAPEPGPEDDSPGAAAVRDMHQAAREWDAWQPSCAQEQAAKDMVNRMEAGARHRDDELRFARGKTATSYHPPPARR